jgi:hypothetical protein
LTPLRKINTSVLRNKSNNQSEPKMNTVFSHIVQKRLPDKYENIATEALAFILHSNESARTGLMKFLRGIAKLPSLQFRTQQTDDNTRPDMCGFDGTTVRVFIENKFWAGLTENQPVNYLKRLAEYDQPSVLLMVVPAARQVTMWRELRRCIEDAKVSVTSSWDDTVGGVQLVATGIGPILALTSWEVLLSALKTELTDEPQAKSDLLQLSALCDAVKDQRIPSFFLQLNKIREGAVEKAITAGVLGTKVPDKNPKKGQLLPQSSWKRFGRYVFFPQSGAGPWLGTEFTLWKDQGSTPLWLVFTHGGSVFANGEWQRDPEIRVLLEPWASDKGVPAVWRKNDDGDDEFAVGIELATGEEEEAVIASVVNQLKEIAAVLSDIGRKRK